MASHWINFWTSQYTFNGKFEILNCGNVVEKIVIIVHESTFNQWWWVSTSYSCQSLLTWNKWTPVSQASWEFSVAIIKIYIDILYNAQQSWWWLSPFIYYGSSMLPLYSQSVLHTLLFISNSCCSPLWAVKSLRNDLWKHVHIMKSDSDGSVAKSKPNSSLCLSLSQWTTSVS